MKIKVDLIKKYIIDYINNNIEDFEISADKIADSVAIDILSEIQKIIQDDKISDFEAIEKIVCVFERYEIDFGNRHDFG